MTVTAATAALLFALAVSIQDGALLPPPAVPPQPAVRAEPPANGDPTTVLGPGQAAPELAIDQWLKGEPVARFEPGRVYVIEFWATWCGPCVQGIGHLTELQREFGPAGLTVIGVTARDARNELPAIKQMVAMRGEGMDYSVAFDANGTTYRRYMTAAKQTGIPASFVIGKDGTLEFVGHPSALDLVVPKLLDGTWNREQDLANVRKAQAALAEIDALYRQKTDVPASQDALTKIKAFEAAWPRYADQYLLTRAEFERRAGDIESMHRTLDAVEARAMKVRDLLTLRGIAIRNFAHQSEPGMLERMERVAEASVAFSGETDGTGMRILAKIYYSRGKLQPAIDMMKKAVAHVEPGVKARLEAELEVWLDEAKRVPPTGGAAGS
jgi:thiol-disulfide isomerase/thioredoxin